MVIRSNLCGFQQVPRPLDATPLLIFFANFLGGSMWTTMQNLEVLAWKMTYLEVNVTNRPTDQPTDQQTDIWISRAPIELKISIMIHVENNCVVLRDAGVFSKRWISGSTRDSNYYYYYYAAVGEEQLTQILLPHITRCIS